MYMHTFKLHSKATRLFSLNMNDTSASNTTLYLGMKSC